MLVVRLYVRFLNENLNSPVKLVVSGVSAQLLMRKQEHQVPLSVD